MRPLRKMLRRAVHVVFPSVLCVVFGTSGCSRLAGVGAAYGIYDVVADDGPTTRPGHGPSVVLLLWDEDFDTETPLFFEFAVAELPLAGGGGVARYFRMTAQLDLEPEGRVWMLSETVFGRLWTSVGFEFVSFPGAESENDVSDMSLGAGIGLQGDPELPFLWFVELSGSVWVPFWLIAAAIDDPGTDYSGSVHWGASSALTAGFKWRF